MNHTLTILVIVIALCRALTVQADIEQPCTSWLSDDLFTDGDFSANKQRAEEIIFFPPTNLPPIYDSRTRLVIQPNNNVMKDLENVNLWTIGYAKTIIFNYTLGTLFPKKYCKALGQDSSKSMKNMTPDNTQMHCPDWLKLNGYGENIKNNKKIAEKQFKYKVVAFFSQCNRLYTYYIRDTPTNRALPPIEYCTTVLNIQPDTYQTFGYCY